MIETLEQYRARLNGAAITTYVIMMLIVPLKIWCRWSTSGERISKLGLDDMLCVLSFIFSNAFFYVCMLGLGPNLGKHALTEMPVSALTTFLEFLFAASLLYIVSAATIKYTMLAFYWRLFSVASRTPILITSLLVTAWLVSITFVLTFICNPVQAQWDTTIVGAKCLSLSSVYVAGSTPNVVADVFILLLPIPYVWRLQAPLPQRLLLLFTFMLGCFVSIVSIIRLVILIGIPLGSSDTGADTTYNVREVIIWSVVEINVGLVSACLPSMKPALRLLRLDRLRSRISANPSNVETGPARVTGQGTQINISRRGLFSSLTGVERLDEEEDTFQMIHKAMANHGKTESNVESTISLGSDVVRKSEVAPRTQERNVSISVQRDWRVMIEKKKQENES